MDSTVHGGGARRIQVNLLFDPKNRSGEHDARAPRLIHRDGMSVASLNRDLVHVIWCTWSSKSLPK